MQSDYCFCEYCLEKNEKHSGLSVKDSQWLEELGELIEAAVEGSRKMQPMSAGCNRELAA